MLNNFQEKMNIFNKEMGKFWREMETPRTEPNGKPRTEKQNILKNSLEGLKSQRKDQLTRRQINRKY